MCSEDERLEYINTKKIIEPMFTEWNSLVYNNDICSDLIAELIGYNLIYYTTVWHASMIFDLQEPILSNILNKLFVFQYIYITEIHVLIHVYNYNVCNLAQLIIDPTVLWYIKIHYYST